MDILVKRACLNSNIDLEKGSVTERERDSEREREIERERQRQIEREREGGREREKKVKQKDIGREDQESACVRASVRVRERKSK